MAAAVRAGGQRTQRQNHQRSRAAIRLPPQSGVAALRVKEQPSVPHVIGRPKEYDPEKLAGPLKTIWLAAMQPCGERLKAALPEWLPAYETDHWRLDSDVRQALLDASRATLDRLLVPARIAHRRRATTRPGTLLHQQTLDVRRGGHSDDVERDARPFEPR